MNTKFEWYPLLGGDVAADPSYGARYDVEMNEQQHFLAYYNDGVLGTYRTDALARAACERHHAAMRKAAPRVLVNASRAINTALGGASSKTVSEQAYTDWLFGRRIRRVFSKRNIDFVFGEGHCASAYYTGLARRREPV